MGDIMLPRITIGVVAFRAINDRPYEMNVKPSFANPVPVRWTVTAEGLAEANHYFRHRRKCKRIPNSPPKKKRTLLGCASFICKAGVYSRRLGADMICGGSKLPPYDFFRWCIAGDGFPVPPTAPR